MSNKNLSGGFRHRKRIIVAVIALLVLMLGSCATSSNDLNEMISAPDTTLFQSELPDDNLPVSDTLPVQSGLPDDNLPVSGTSCYPLYFPMPYYHAFIGGQANEFLGNIDAFLHNTAVNYYSSRVDANSGHLLLVSLRLIDEWDTGDGAAYYLCFMAEYDYYGLAEQFFEKETYDDRFIGDGTGYSLGGLIRFKVTPLNDDEPNVTNFWGFSAIEILEQPMWGTAGGTVVELCGDRPIMDALLKAENGTCSYSDVPYIRDILPSEYAHDKTALLEKYLEAFFPELQPYDSYVVRNA